MLSAKDPPHIKRYTQIKSKDLEKIFQANEKGKKAGVATLISNKVGKMKFQKKNKDCIVRETEGHYIMIKGKNPTGYNLSKHIYTQQRST